ncbi:MAG TPA: SulP family inorganic anion transporter [Solirubrobacteraceae bacterium]|nr:SulP family inorganic anion transporter [Solirubrobacteraceae bacterium]
MRNYRRDWLGADAIAGVIVWGVVTPQCVAYAKIAGLPPEAGLMAAPPAMIGYALLGQSRSLIVSATTATSAVSATTVGAMAHGDAARFAALSAALALVCAAVLVAAGALRLGGIADLVSKPVMTGFLFGLGLTIIIGQLPAALGLAAGSGNFIPRLRNLVSHLGSTDVGTLLVGAGSLGLLIVLKRLAPRVPGTLVVLALAIVVSAVFDLKGHGVDVVGHLPTALPKPAFPGVSAHDFAQLVPAAFGVMLLTTEAVGVARALASQQHESIQPNRELIALGTANALAGLSSGFVQSGGASQTAAAEAAGGKSQLTAVIAAGLLLVTGAFLAPLFTDLPEATLSAIVILAVAGFLRVDELRRFARVRRSAIVFALVAVFSVLVLGVLPGLIVAAVLSLGRVLALLSRPTVAPIGRDAETGAWRIEAADAPAQTPAETLTLRVSGQLFFANSLHVKDQIVQVISERDPPPHRVVLDLAQSAGLDLESLDMIDELATDLGERHIELVLAAVHAAALEILRRGGVLDRVTIAPTLDGATGSEPLTPVT